jgi:FkbM family methyltransferase
MMSDVELVTLAAGFSVVAPNRRDAEFIHSEIFWCNCYGDPALPSDAFVVDVGANIGLFTLFVKRRYPRSRILAFEPIPECARAFQRNMQLHNLTGVTLEQRALGATDERDVPFAYYPTSPGNSTRYPEQKVADPSLIARRFGPGVTADYRGEPVLADVTTLSAALPPQLSVDLLKVDVEGAELAVLEGIDAEDWPRIARVVVEVEDMDNRLAAVTDVLHRHGYQTTVSSSLMVPGNAQVGIYQVTARRPSASEQPQ